MVEMIHAHVEVERNTNSVVEEWLKKVIHTKSIVLGDCRNRKVVHRLRKSAVHDLFYLSKFQ